MIVNRLLVGSSRMRRLYLTLPTPEENVACDEALLDWAEDDDRAGEFLRLWESPQPVVVVGRSSRVGLEVHEDVCRQHGVPILRRSSGGAAIVAGPGCLMYALVLSHKLRPELRDIRRAHAEVLNRLADSLNDALAGAGSVARAGTSDLIHLETGSKAGSARKFSGNSLRVRRNHLLYHGTLLHGFDLRLMESCLRLPPRQPDYREQRPHAEFVANLPLSRQALTNAVDRAWPTDRHFVELPSARIANLIAERFGRSSWNVEYP
jgi:lipoate-protein ligase A